MTLVDVLTFYTGSDKVPPLGFVPAPTLAFNSAAYYPSSSTCSLTLYLPTKYEDYCAFKSRLLYAFKNHGGFGLA